MLTLVQILRMNEGERTTTLPSCFVCNYIIPGHFKINTLCGCEKLSVYSAEQVEVYLFISLAHFDLQVVPLFINFVDEGVQLFAGFLNQQTHAMFCYLGLVFSENIIATNILIK